MWGCTKPVMQPHTFDDDPAMMTCPLTYFRDHPHLEGEVFELHLHWSKGILPDPGGYRDQAQDYSLVIAAVEHGVKMGRARLQEVEQRKAESKNRKTGGQSGGSRRRG